MIKFLTSYIILFLNLAYANGSIEDSSVLINDLNYMRETYYSAVEEETFIDSLESFLYANYPQPGFKDIPIILAYYAGLDALKAKHAFNPFAKMNYLDDSMNKFEKAIKIEPANLEIRFMRFSILHYVPGILGYGGERDDDLKIIYKLLMKKNYSLLNRKIQTGIVEFLIDSERMNNKELLELKRLIGESASR